jgi:hypothetical protein
LRTSGSYVRECVYERDHGICAICNVDTRVVAKKLYQILLSEPFAVRNRKKKYHKKSASNDSLFANTDPMPHSDAYLSLCKEYSISPNRKVWGRKYGGGLWDADHIVPVEQGGGECGLENYRTLCICCHKCVTWMRT